MFLFLGGGGFAYWYLCVRKRKAGGFAHAPPRRLTVSEEYSGPPLAEVTEVNIHATTPNETKGHRASLLKSFAPKSTDDVECDELQGARRLIGRRLMKCEGSSLNTCSPSHP